MKVAIQITTCRRPEMLAKLLDDIERDFPPQWEPWICVTEDRTPDVVYPDKMRSRVQRWDAHYHGSVDQYQDIIRQQYAMSYTQSWQRLLQLPDDVRLAPDFFLRVEDTWRSIADPKKICLSPLWDGRRQNWTGWEALDLGNVYLTQWNDLCYWTTRSWLDLVHPMPRIQRKSQGTGIGSWMSHKAHSMGLRMYHVKETLVFHGDHPSIMHPDVRVLQPLIA